MSLANGHRTTIIPGLDEPIAATDEKPFESPITDQLRRGGVPWAVAPPTEEEIAAGLHEEPQVHWADELRQWWINTADRDISQSLDKVVAYGGRGAAYDLIATGKDLAAMNGRPNVSDEEATELGILFYVSSKLNRWMAAAIDGRRVSDDTLLDAAYYIGMARRNRAVGGWPVA